MKRLFVLLIALMVSLMSLTVSAQNGYPMGYQVVYSAPAAGMQAIGYTCTIKVYDAGHGMAQVAVTAAVDAYIVWVTPARPPEYYIGFNLNGVRYWTMYTPQALAASCG